MPTPKTAQKLDTRFLRFLQEELLISAAAIKMALRYCNNDVHLLPVTLWRYGLVSLEQLDLMFEWLATA
ncbi:DUF2949 domain-containing protein [Trichothermofontia sichuanensis B231]|uniref:DUF2949 domain-containing protein n=1 Tax=Trichothermofontia sichuanensis TaxID=3045816 RepID=UPI0022454B54|nr:DUF2949 domain-containing protein [Trichothermofontia sichuanensis]UZQ53415.1 DUF2949 domain-containing protein [Trichothermofontia sichuanensis B231]